MSHAPHIVITRNKKLAGEHDLEVMGWRFVHHDFIQRTIEIPNQLAASDIQQNIVITSQIGVKAFVEILDQFELNKSNYFVFCIAHASKEMALRSGLIVRGFAFDSKRLAQEILRHPTINSVTHVCGNMRRDQLSEELQRSNVAVHEIFAYRTELTPIKLAGTADGIVFYSPSGIESFLTENPVPKSVCFCIGQTTSHHAKQRGFKSVLSAEAPTEKAIMNLITNYFSKHKLHAKK